jgi:predicted enzyme related to lactoylglutathione lyase
MALPVVHFEIIGRDPAALRRYYGQLFGWTFDTGNPVADAVSVPTDYGFTTSTRTPDGTGANGGIGGGPDYAPQTIFYIGVEDVAKTLARAVELGGRQVLGPAASPTAALVIAQFTDPEGNRIGLAGPK